jgi:hypothetical protein
MDFTNSKPPKKIKRNGPSMGLESVGELLKNDWFNLDGLVGLMAVRPRACHQLVLWGCRCKAKRTQEAERTQKYVSIPSTF